MAELRDLVCQHNTSEIVWYLLSAISLLNKGNNFLSWAELERDAIVNATEHHDSAICWLHADDSERRQMQHVFDTRGDHLKALRSLEHHMRTDETLSEYFHTICCNVESIA